MELEQQNKDNEQSTAVQNLPTKVSLICRVLVGAYVLYLAASMGNIFEKYSGQELVIYGAAMLVLGMGALGLIFTGGKKLILGMYIGGSKDLDFQNERD